MDEDTRNRVDESNTAHSASSKGANSESTQNEQNIAPLREEYQNAKAQLDQQVQTFRAFANEGQTMLRITLIFVGLLLTALSALGPEVASQTVGSTTCAINLPTSPCIHISSVSLASGLSLGISALAHGSVTGNEARAVANKATVSDIQNALTIQGEEEYLRERLDRYKTRIEQNDRYIAFLEEFLSIGKLSLTFSISGLTTVAIAVATGPIPAKATITILILLLGIGYSSIRYLPDAVIEEDGIWYSYLGGDDDE